MANDNDCSGYVTLDAYSPREMACKARSIGAAKADLDFLSTLMLSILASMVFRTASVVEHIPSPGQWKRSSRAHYQGDPYALCMDSALSCGNS